MSIERCAICGEDAILVSVGRQYMVSVRRSTKCKKYYPWRKDNKGSTCKTQIYDNEIDAINEWNSTNKGENNHE